jgi:hypothetical protein
LHTLNQFNEQYKGLFGTRDDEDDDDTKTTKSIEEEFQDNFGWVYNAYQVAEFEKIPLDAVYDLPVIQFLNDLSYLKQKQSVDEYQHRQRTKEST